VGFQTTADFYLDERARQMNSLLCIGLDPHVKDLEEPNLESARSFCLRLIQATADLALAYKPNIAFFEVFGPPGLQVLKEIIEAVPEEIPVILDAKRGDMPTADVYAKAIFKTR
jgi:uridine monophosphate synthetase